jgi:hypothetical protein
VIERCLMVLICILLLQLLRMFSQAIDHSAFFYEFPVTSLVWTVLHVTVSVHGV